MESGSIVFDGGFSVQIVGMLDRFGLDTEDPEEAEELFVRMPPDGIILRILAEDYRRQLEVVDILH